MAKMNFSSASILLLSVLFTVSSAEKSGDVNELQIGVKLIQLFPFS
ncbi:hypothetical protein SLEP1_g42481 [Rubroshorea leprosula]|uniref:Uncharacterized protein n=1 Tax=Rubroshorea leprosula TaxID=152421 RepID=A0AAV5L9X5_9ROSI|nr:hypothetical protein SLEP1_g42481 [Rubroshorea leprosula]